MSYTEARERFLMMLATDGWNATDARLLLRMSQTAQDYAEELCSGPGKQFFGTASSGDVDKWQTGLERKRDQLDTRIETLARSYNATADVEGDPRGCVVKLTLRDGREYGVPVR